MDFDRERFLGYRLKVQLHAGCRSNGLAVRAPIVRKTDKHPNRHIWDCHGIHGHHPCPFQENQENLKSRGVMAMGESPDCLLLSGTVVGENPDMSAGTQTHQGRQQPRKRGGQPRNPPGGGAARGLMGLYTHTHTEPSDSITSSANTGGNNLGLPNSWEHAWSRLGPGTALNRSTFREVPPGKPLLGTTYYLPGSRSQ